MKLIFEKIFENILASVFPLLTFLPQLHAISFLQIFHYVS